MLFFLLPCNLGLFFNRLLAMLDDRHLKLFSLFQLIEKSSFVCLLIMIIFFYNSDADGAVHSGVYHSGRDHPVLLRGHRLEDQEQQSGETEDSGQHADQSLILQSWTLSSWTLEPYRNWRGHM